MGISLWHHDLFSQIIIVFDLSVAGWTVDTQDVDGLIFPFKLLKGGLADTRRVVGKNIL